MKKAMLGMSLLMGLSLVASISFAAPAQMIKTKREDFNALIQEGLDSQKQLRKELREKSGQEEQKHWAAEVKENGRVLMGTLDPEQIVSPTTKYVRQKLSAPTLQDIQQDRVSSEFENLEK